MQRDWEKELEEYRKDFADSVREHLERIPGVVALVNHLLDHVDERLQQSLAQGEELKLLILGLGVELRAIRERLDEKGPVK